MFECLYISTVFQSMNICTSTIAHIWCQTQVDSTTHHLPCISYHAINIVFYNNDWLRTKSRMVGVVCLHELYGNSANYVIMCCEWKLNTQTDWLYSQKHRFPCNEQVHVCNCSCVAPNRIISNNIYIYIYQHSYNFVSETWVYTTIIDS